MRASSWLAAGRTLGILGWTLWIALANLRTLLRGKGVSPRVSLAWHGRVARICGLDIRVHGRPVTERAVLYVSNHASYLDIIALSTTLPCCFVSKAEVNDWPVFGWLARQQRTVFIERRARRAGEQLDILKQRLEDGDHMVVFPEGTSTDGARVLPFKSSLFEAARANSHESDMHRGDTVAIQPVSIAYSRLDGMPMGRAFRPLFTWYGDMDLGPHLWTMLGLGRVGIDLVFHEPVRLSDFESRKHLADHCWRAVSDGLSGALRGRPGDSLNRTPGE
nr:lysophospholipid acyltransferase family protein [Marivibrio halodurans]